MGCDIFSTGDDGESVADIPREKEYAIFDYLIERIKERFDNREIQLLDVVEMFEYNDYKYVEEFFCNNLQNILLYLQLSHYYH
jgi:hypothetical protein